MPCPFLAIRIGRAERTARGNTVGGFCLVGHIPYPCVAEQLPALSWGLRLWGGRRWRWRRWMSTTPGNIATLGCRWIGKKAASEQIQVVAVDKVQNVKNQPLDYYPTTLQ